jgi:hypothetical protein
MALSRGMTALRAALGAVGGGLEGYTQMQELERKRMREEEATRQAQQAGIANLMLQGFDRPESVLQRQQGARQAAGSAIASALQAASGQPATPLMGDFKALGEGFATARPDRTVTIGGQTLALRETAPEREQRLAQTKTMQEAQAFENAVAQLPAELQQVARASKTISPNVLQTIMQPREGRQPRLQLNEKTGQIINLDTREAFDIPGYKQPPKEAKGEGAGGGGAKGGRSAEAQAALQTMLPTIRANNQRLQEMTPEYVNKLSGLKVMAAAKAPLLANRDDVLGFIGGSLANMASNPEAREYASIARAVTDAVARASEVGVLTNQDIARYQGQILFMPGDTKADRARKFNTLKSWAGWLDNNKEALTSGSPTQVTAAPDDLMAEYPQAATFIQAARSQGESEMAIRRLLEANQGRRR